MTHDAAGTKPSRLAPEGLLAPDLMKKLDQLELGSRLIHPGSAMGERVARRRGFGMEFSEHKGYAPGDDFRTIDWNVYARLDEFVVKIFESEENLAVCILADASASMDFGTGPTKWEFAARLAAALGYIALVNRDSLATVLFSDRLQERFDGVRGRAHLRRMLRLLAETSPAGRSDFSQALRAAGRQLHHPGLCFVISDFCAADDLEEALRGLIFHGHEVVAVHVTDPVEADPGLEGEIDLQDAETGELVPMTVRGDTARRYREAFETRCRQVARACAAYDATYLRVSTMDSIEHTLLYRLRRLNIVR